MPSDRRISEPFAPPPGHLRSPWIASRTLLKVGYLIATFSRKVSRWRSSAILRRAVTYPAEEKRHVKATRARMHPTDTTILRLTLAVRVRPCELTIMSVKTRGRLFFTVGRLAGRLLSTGQLHPPGANDLEHRILHWLLLQARLLCDSSLRQITWACRMLAKLRNLLTRGARCSQSRGTHCCNCTVWRIVIVRPAVSRIVSFPVPKAHFTLRSTLDTLVSPKVDMVMASLLESRETHLRRASWIHHCLIRGIPAVRVNSTNTSSICSSGLRSFVSVDLVLMI